MGEELYPTTFNKQVYKQLQDQVPTQENLPPSVTRHNINNPFNQEQFRDVSLPDTPLQYGGGITEALLGDRDVPEKIKKPFWYVFIKDNILTFLDSERKDGLMLNFDIVKIDTLNSVPYYDYTFDAELKWNVLRNVYETKLNRSLGFKSSNVKNERVLLQSQFTEQRNINEQNMSQSKDGFFKRLLGRR